LRNILIRENSHGFGPRKPGHILTLEYPIEYEYKPHKSFIRQREIERDTPSMQQGLLDSVREDPDVMVVGEMRDPETMRLTLNAAETGHLGTRLHRDW
jgi:twitching motility protein PilT